MHQEISVLAEQAKRLVKELYGVLDAERGYTAQIADTAHAAHLNRKADQPVGEHAHAVNHEIHHHGVIGVLGAAQSSLDNGETGLHEHDQETRDQCPDKIDRNFVLPDLICHVGNGETFRLRGLIGDRVGDRYVGHRSGKRSIRIAGGALFSFRCLDALQIGVSNGNWGGGRRRWRGRGGRCLRAPE